MTLRVVFRPAARAEFDGAALWYEDRRPGLGAQFVSEVGRVIELISNHPGRYPVKVQDIRCIRVRRFPYSVYYLVEREEVVVLAVFHGRRDPALWQARR